MEVYYTIGYFRLQANGIQAFQSSKEILSRKTSTVYLSRWNGKCLQRYFNTRFEIIIDVNLLVVIVGFSYVLLFFIFGSSLLCINDTGNITVMGPACKFKFHFFSLQTITGSTTLFTALLKKSLERDVTAICKYISGKNFPPRFVALVPQVNL